MWCFWRCFRPLCCGTPPRNTRTICRNRRAKSTHPPQACGTKEASSSFMVRGRGREWKGKGEREGREGRGGGRLRDLSYPETLVDVRLYIIRCVGINSAEALWDWLEGPFVESLIPNKVSLLSSLHPLSVRSCSPSFSISCILRMRCFYLHTAHTSHVIHNTPHTTHSTQYNTRTTYNTQHTTHNTQHTTHNTQHIAHHMPLTTRNTVQCNRQHPSAGGCRYQSSQTVLQTEPNRWERPSIAEANGVCHIRSMIERGEVGGQREREERW